MKKFALAVVLLSVVVLSGIAVQSQSPLLTAQFGSMLALVFPERLTPEMLKAHYEQGRLRVLVVPGHDAGTGGTQFKGVFERDINAAIGHYVAEYLAEDPRVQVHVAREEDGELSPWFTSYLEKNEKEVLSFRERMVRLMADALANGSFVKKEPVVHNTAPSRAALMLYAINKYANDNDIDVVLHLHVNDYAGRSEKKVGKYKGFAIYAPEVQLPNARVSRGLAQSIHKTLVNFIPESNYPKEGNGLVEDQELIAIGSNASRDGVSLLIEYGYIYEPIFQKESLRGMAVQELAFQTAKGVRKYFRPNPKQDELLSLDKEDHFEPEFSYEVVGEGQRSTSGI